MIERMYTYIVYIYVQVVQSTYRTLVTRLSEKMRSHAGVTCGGHMQGSHAGVTCRGHMQGSHAGATCRGHMQGSHAGATCRGHMQGPHAGVTCRGHMQGSHAGVTYRDRKCPLPILPVFLPNFPTSNIHILCTCTVHTCI